MDESKELPIPGTEDVLRPGYQVKLGRFDTTLWTVGFGWYSASGNRPCCGWYLTADNGRVTKPIHDADLGDIYVINICYLEGKSTHRSIEAIDEEIVDLRLSSDGTKYETSGEAVRSQISHLEGMIENLQKQIDELK